MRIDSSENTLRNMGCKKEVLEIHMENHFKYQGESISEYSQNSEPIKEKNDKMIKLAIKISCVKFRSFYVTKTFFKSSKI